VGIYISAVGRGLSKGVVMFRLDPQTCSNCACESAWTHQDDHGELGRRGKQRLGKEPGGEVLGKVLRVSIMRRWKRYASTHWYLPRYRGQGGQEFLAALERRGVSHDLSR